MELMEVEQALKSVEALKTEVQTLRNQIAMSEKKSNKILSTREACEYMKVGRPIINLWRETGLVKNIKVGGNGRWLYMQNDLDSLFNQWNGFDITTKESIEIAKAQKKREASN